MIDSPEELSRRSALRKMASFGLWVGGGAASAWAVNELGIPDIIQDAFKGGSRLEYGLAALSEVQKAALEKELVDRLFAPVAETEKDQAFGFIEKTESSFDKKDDGWYQFSINTADGKKAFGRISLDSKGLAEENGLWYIPGLAGLDLQPTLAKDHKLAITILEPNYPGVDTKSEAFSSNILEIILAKQLSVLVVAKAMENGVIDGDLVAKSIAVMGYSAGGSAALALAEHYPQLVKKLSLESGIYNILDPVFKEKVLNVIKGKEKTSWVEGWMGFEFLLTAINSPTNLSQQVEDLRKLMILCSPYLWVDKIPVNSMTIEMGHGRKDTITPFSQSESVYQRLTNLGWDPKHLQFTRREADHF